MEQHKPLEGLDDDTIIVKMTVEEYIEYKESKKKKTPNVGKGLKAIMEIFGCSKSKAFEISHADWFKPAIIIRHEKFFSFDKDIALKLAKENSK